MNLSLSKEWHPTKNGGLTPSDVTPNSHKKVWWVCNNKHEWQAAIKSRNNGNACPYCSGKAVCDDNCLATLNPQLAKEWHPTKNGGLTPSDVTPGSNKKVWWVCNNKHEWQAAIVDRSNGNACPYCSGKAVCDDNCLATLNPQLAKEWHPTKNGGLTPSDVTPNSHKKVWWICNKKHAWDAVVANRNNGRGCPFCSGKAVCDDNCLATLNPQLAKEWHPTKNGGLTPSDVTPNSHKKVCWVCNKKHEWKAAIVDRNKDGGCPFCSGKAVCDDNCLATLNPQLAKEWHPTKNGGLTPSDVTPNSGKKVWWICKRKHAWDAVVEVDGFVKTIFLSFLDALHREEWLPER